MDNPEKRATLGTQDEKKPKQNNRKTVKTVMTLAWYRHF